MRAPFSRRVLPALGAVALLAIAGTGFSAFVAHGTVHGTATAASFGLVVTAVGLPGSPPYVLLKTTPLPADLVTVWINNTPPESVFNLSVTVKNIGTVTAEDVTWVTSVSTHGPATCSVGAYFTIISTNDPAGDVLAAGASYGTNWYLHSGAFPAACAGQNWMTLTITWTATAGE